MGNSPSFQSFLECHDFHTEAKSRVGSNTIAGCMADIESEDEGGFDDIYEVDINETLGAGKFSSVHPCWRRNQPEKRYAMKMINTLVAESASMKQIQDEIRILQMLGGHSGLIELIEADQTMPNCIRLVMEICEGGELYERVQKYSYFSESESRLCIHNLMEAVAYIHSKGVIHRDLKPENILLVSQSSNTDIKISDFGLAKTSREWPGKLPRATSICGSDFYLAPELIKQQEYGREIDIWAVGVITYIVLSGSLPFFSTILHKLYRQIVERDLSFTEKPWRTVSKSAQDFILRMLQVRPGDRPSADEALHHPWIYDVSAVLSGAPLQNITNSRSYSRTNGSAETSQLEHAHKVGSLRPA